MSAEQRIRELKLELRPPSAPVANYVNAVRTGNLLFLAGKGPRGAKGKVGREVTVEQAYQHAREVGVDLLAVMRAERGSLARSAVGMGSLPMGIPVEIECIIEVE